MNDSNSLQQGGLFNNKPTLKQEIQVEADQYSTGNLILINKETKLQADPTNLSAIPAGLSNNVRFRFYTEVPSFTPIQRKERS